MYHYISFTRYYGAFHAMCALQSSYYTQTGVHARRKFRVYIVTATRASTPMRIV